MPFALALALAALAASPVCPVEMVTDHAQGVTHFVRGHEVTFSLPSVDWSLQCEERALTVSATAFPFALTFQADSTSQRWSWSGVRLNEGALPTSITQRATSLEQLGYRLQSVEAELGRYLGKTLEAAPGDAGTSTFGPLRARVGAMQTAARLEADRLRLNALRASSPFLLTRPERIGEIAADSFLLTDLFWSKRTLCVAQGKGAALVRCYDPVTRAWGRKEPRTGRAADRANILVQRVGSPHLEDWNVATNSPGESWSLDLLGVPKLSDPFAEQVEKELAEVARQCALCPGTFCGGCPEEERSVSWGSPTALLLSESFAVLVVPVGTGVPNCWAGGSQCGDDTITVHHYGLWLLARTR